MIYFKPEFAKELPDNMESGGGYDWSECLRGGHGTNSARPPEAPEVIGDLVSKAPFDLCDIRLVVFAQAGQNDERPWNAVVLLKDNRWAFFGGDCDYTGWG